MRPSMFEHFVLTSKKNKVAEFLKAIKKDVPDWKSELDVDFLDYMWLAEQSDSHKFDSLSVICAEVVFPMILGNYFILREDGKPVAYSSWGFFSESISQIKMAAHRGALVRSDYNTGNTIWLMDVIAPWGHSKKVIQKLLDTKRELGYTRDNPVNFRRWYGAERRERINKAVC